MGVNVVLWAEVLAGVVGVAGIVLDVMSLVRRRGVRLAATGLVLRGLGLALLGAFVLAGQGRPDFQDLVFVLYGMLAAIALWLAALVTDGLLLARHWRT